MKASPLNSSDFKGNMTKGNEYKRLRHSKRGMD